MIAIQQIEAVAQHAALEIRFVRRAERAAKFKWHRQRARWLDFLGMLADQTDLRCRDTLIFEIMCQPANGARTLRSNGAEDDNVDIIRLEDLG